MSTTTAPPGDLHHARLHPRRRLRRRVGRDCGPLVASWMVLVVATSAFEVPFASAKEVTLLNASYDVTRELYKDINATFAAAWKKRTGDDLVVNQSHGGSSKQARAVIDGLGADVVTMNQSIDIDLIAALGGQLPKDWAGRLPNHSVPFTSTIVFLVRKGNPKKVKDWDDLVRPGVVPIIPNPKTSGNGRYSYLAAWAHALRRSKGNEAPAREFVGKLFKAVPVMDAGGRGATTTFVQRRIGDVLLTFENEAQLALSEGDSVNLETVVPPFSILAENPVAVVDKVAAKHGTTALATAYLDFLFTDEAQEIGARHFFRPIRVSSSGHEFPAIELVSVPDLGGWPTLQKTHFADGGVFDQIFLPR